MNAGGAPKPVMTTPGYEEGIMRIRGLSEEEAGKLRGLYRAARERYGKLPDPLTVMAYNPAALSAHMKYDENFNTSQLVDMKLKEIAQIKVATLVGCPW